MYLCYIVKETVKEETPAANLPGGTVVQLLSLVRFFEASWTAVHQASLSLTISQDFAPVHVP